MTEITIPDSVTSIGAEAFIGCYNLREITIQNSVTTIKYNAFDGCSSLNVIKGTAGSYAETYAKDKGYTFEEVID